MMNHLARLRVFTMAASSMMLIGGSALTALVAGSMAVAQAQVAVGAQAQVNTVPPDGTTTKTLPNGSVVTTVRTGVPGDRTVDRSTLRTDGKTSSTDKTIDVANGTRTVDTAHTNVNGGISTKDAATSKNAQGGYDRTVNKTGPNGGTSTKSTMTTNMDGEHTRTTDISRKAADGATSTRDTTVERGNGAYNRQTDTSHTTAAGVTTSRDTDVTRSKGTETIDTTKTHADGKTSSNDVTKNGKTVTDTHTGQNGKVTVHTHPRRR